MRAEFRMSDGTMTTNAKKMIKAWRDLYNPLCKKFGMEVIGFDPGILFSYSGTVVDMPVSLVEKVRDACTE